MNGIIFILRRQIYQSGPGAKWLSILIIFQKNKKKNKILELGCGAGQIYPYL